MPAIEQFLLSSEEMTRWRQYMHPSPKLCYGARGMSAVVADSVQSVWD